MTYIGPRDFYLEIQRGNVPGLSLVHKFGYNGSIGSGATADIIEQTGTYVWPSGAESLEVLSSLSGDDGSPAGIGGHTVELEGLDANWDLQTDTKTLDGTTPVAFSGTWRRTNRLKVTAAGSSLTNVGVITCRVASAGATRIIIGIGNGQSLFGMYTVPNAKTAYVQPIYGSLTRGSPAGSQIDWQMFVRNAAATNPAWQLKQQRGFISDGTTALERTFMGGLIVGEKHDIRLVGHNASAAGVAIDGGFDLVLEDD